MFKNIYSLPFMLVIVILLSLPAFAADIAIEEDLDDIDPEVDEEIIQEGEEVDVPEKNEGLLLAQQDEEEGDNEVEYDLEEMDEENTEGTKHDPRVRIGDITRISGERNNQLTGFGLVTGLADTGDSGQNEETLQTRVNVLKQFGIKVSEEELNDSNTAAVMVTATLPPYVNPGDEIDVTVSSWGDAESLQGGTLLQTPLVGADNNVYAVAQGAISIGGFDVQGRRGNQERQNHPTVGTMPRGAIVEDSLDQEIPEDEFSIYLDNGNFDTASQIVQTINEAYDRDDLARAVTPSEVVVTVPEEVSSSMEFIAQVNNLEVRPDVPARVVINEREGTIAMTHNVRISTVSVQKGDLSITITSQMNVDQPPPFSEGETVEGEQEEITVDEEESAMQMIEQQPTIEDLVVALNKIGATPRDMISIIKEIDSAGALHAELELE
ncbi:MAG: flagellar basal body P-ring protein FlgI [Halanaerobiaceae bacterium]